MRMLVAALLGVVLCASLALARTAPAPAPQSPPAKVVAPTTAKAPAYDPKAEVTIKGVVEELHESRSRGDHPGLHLIVRTEVEAVEVHTCPVRFMKDLDFAVQKGDAVGVIGSRPADGTVVVAREIKIGQTSLTLRDKAGTPVWTR